MSVSSIGGPPAIDKLKQAEKPASPKEDEKLKKSCHEMEGYFVGMLLKKMHESAMKGGLFQEKSEGATYRDMFDDAVATQIGKKGSFGIADMLYRELSKRQSMETTDGSPTTEPAKGNAAAAQPSAVSPVSTVPAVPETKPQGAKR